MDVKFACSDFTFPLLTHGKALDLIRLLDFDAVDIGLFQDRSHIQPDQAFKDVRGSARALRQELDQRHLEPADVFLQTATDFESTAVNHPAPRVREFSREMFTNTLDFARELGSHHVSIVPGVHFEQESFEDSFARAVSELKWRVERAADYGITAAVEPHLDSICEDPKTASRLAESTPGLTFTLDYTHFTKKGMADDEIEPLMRLASHFHARGACEGRLQCPLSRNTIDYERVLAAMKETGYSGYIGIEYVWIEWENLNEVDNVSESVMLRARMQEAADRI